MRDLCYCLEQKGMSPSATFMVLSTFSGIASIKDKLNNVRESQRARGIETEGSFIVKLAILNHGCSVGDNCVINTRALIEHGCHIKNHVNVSTNATLNGDVICEEGSFIGSGTVVNGQLTIGEWSLVGSGAVVIKDVRPHTTVVGVPAKEIQSTNHKYN